MEYGGFEFNPYEIPYAPYPPEQIRAALEMTDEDVLAEAQPERIGIFLSDVMSWLQVLIAAQYVLFYQPMREPLRAAYEEVRDRHEELVTELEYVDVERLRENGLTGESLRMKLTGYLTARNRFWRRGGIKYLKLMLKWINTILGSIAAALPPAHALTEVKDAIERVIEDTEEM